MVNNAPVTFVQRDARPGPADIVKHFDTQLSGGAGALNTVQAALQDDHIWAHHQHWDEPVPEPGGALPRLRQGRLVVADLVPRRLILGQTHGQYGLRCRWDYRCQRCNR